MCKAGLAVLSLSVVFSPDSKTLVSRSTDGMVKLWDMPVTKKASK
jgi:WD40 repeat protein